MNKNLVKLARLHNIQLSFIDTWGRRCPASEDTVVRLLSSMSIQARTAKEVEVSLKEFRSREWKRILPPVLVLQEKQRRLKLVLTLPCARVGERFQWCFLGEDGSEKKGEFVIEDLTCLRKTNLGQEVFCRYCLEISLKAPLGYHEFSIQSKTQKPKLFGSTLLIVSPAKSYLPKELGGGRKMWGPALQLYNVVSKRNWGIGDFTDLGRMVEMFSSLGADVVGLNPLHALSLSDPEQISPYSPVSRSQLNVLFLDVEKVPDYRESLKAQRRVGSKRFQKELTKVRSEEFIDYPGVLSLKMEVLELLFENFQRKHSGHRTAREKKFLEFVRLGDNGLENYARYEALSEHLSRNGRKRVDWSKWPKYYQKPSGKAVDNFAEKHRDRVLFFKYLQWQAHCQLEGVIRQSKKKALGLGLYLDFALSASGSGSDVWSDSSSYAQGAEVGAPPDSFSVKGQKWGFPPLAPRSLRDSGYGAFIQALRFNMKYSGAIRLDHVMSLLRLYWIPEGCEADTGAYVRYPLGELMSIVVLESIRNRCVLVGEDLGTVPERVQDEMKSRGIFSYKVLMFMKNARGQFLSRTRYPQKALVTLTTHDLPTISGFWQGEDLRLRDSLGLIQEESSLDIELRAREKEKIWMISALKKAGLLSVSLERNALKQESMSDAMFFAVLKFISKTSSKLLIVPIEDVIGEINQVNLPGVMDRYPSWRRKLSWDLERLGRERRVLGLKRVLKR